MVVGSRLAAASSFDCDAAETPALFVNRHEAGRLQWPESGLKGSERETPAHMATVPPTDIVFIYSIYIYGSNRPSNSLA